MSMEPSYKPGNAVDVSSQQEKNAPSDSLDRGDAFSEACIDIPSINGSMERISNEELMELREQGFSKEELELLVQKNVEKIFVKWLGKNFGSDNSSTPDQEGQSDENIESKIVEVNDKAFHALYEGKVLSNLNEEEFVQRFCSHAEGVLSVKGYRELLSRVAEYCRTSRNEETDHQLEEILFNIEKSTKSPFIYMNSNMKINYLRAELYDILACIGGSKFDSDLRKAIEYKHQCPMVYEDFSISGVKKLNEIITKNKDKILDQNGWFRKSASDKLLGDLLFAIENWDSSAYGAFRDALKPFEGLCNRARKKGDNTILIHSLYLYGLCLRMEFFTLNRSQATYEQVRNEIKEINSELEKFGSKLTVRY